MALRTKWAVGLGSVGQVPIRLHFTFLLLLPLVAVTKNVDDQTSSFQLVLVLAIFCCVLVHELGHALLARQFGIATREVVLYPFGGIAQLERQGSPRAELAIALAGPVINLLFALLLAPFAQVPQNEAEFLKSDLATRFFAANLVLVIFNVIPAFPLDGGRALRAILEALKVTSATEIVVRISQALSVLLGLLAITTGNAFLIVLALVLFTNAISELVKRKAIAAAAGLKAKDACTPIQNMVVFPHGTSIPKATDIALKTLQTLFPVVQGDTFRGIVTKEKLFDAAASGSEQDYVASLMEHDIARVSADDSLASTAEILQGAPLEVVAVLEEGRLAGFIFREKLIELLLIKGLRERAKQHQALDDEIF